MTCVIIKHPDGELLNYINNFSPVEWWHFGRRYSVKADGKGTLVKSFRPPHFSFRLEDEKYDDIQLIIQLVNSYNGDVKWEIIPHKRINLPGVNWVITPSRVVFFKDIAKEKGMTSEDYLATYQPEISDEEYNDVPGLTQWIKNGLKDKKILKEKVDLFF